MEQRARLETRQHASQQEIDIRSRHQDVARIDHEQIAGLERVEGRRAAMRHRFPQKRDRQSRDVGARRGIDGRDHGRKLTIRDGPRDEARRMAGADLDDPGRPETAHQRIGHGGIQTWEPVLVEARRTAAGCDLRERVAMLRQNFQRPREDRFMLGKERRHRRIEIGRAGRRDGSGIAIGNEEAAPRQPQDRRQPERQPAPGRTTDHEAHEFSRDRPEIAFPARGRSRTSASGACA
jgi:hypothetical protein